MKRETKFFCKFIKILSLRIYINKTIITLNNWDNKIVLIYDLYERSLRIFSQFYDLIFGNFFGYEQLWFSAKMNLHRHFKVYEIKKKIFLILLNEIVTAIHQTSNITKYFIQHFLFISSNPNISNTWKLHQFNKFFLISMYSCAYEWILCFFQ